MDLVYSVHLWGRTCSCTRAPPEGSGGAPIGTLVRVHYPNCNLSNKTIDFQRKLADWVNPSSYQVLQRSVQYGCGNVSHSVGSSKNNVQGWIEGEFLTDLLWQLTNESSVRPVLVINMYSLEAVDQCSTVYNVRIQLINSVVRYLTTLFYFSHTGQCLFPAVIRCGFNWYIHCHFAHTSTANLYSPR